MNFKSQLNDFKEKVDREIEKAFDANISEIKANDPYSAQALEYIKKITLSGGKRLRPALLYYAYLGAGGKEKSKAIKVAAAIELVHMFLLVHDDIIDRGILRHGISTANVEFAKYAKKKFKTADGKHFGDSFALILGDMVYCMAVEMICSSGIDAKVCKEVSMNLQSIVKNTIIGQSQDICIEYRKRVEEKDILKMYENKTAKYTFEGPLLLGLILAGNGNKKISKAFSDFALPLGIAFQIQDDILGIFGNEKKMGKSGASDIEEGKKTLIVAKALEKGSPKEIGIIKNLLGRKNLTKKEVKEFQKAIISSRSLDYAKGICDWHMQQSKKIILNLSMGRQAKEFLLGMIEYMENREV